MKWNNKNATPYWEKYYEDGPNGDGIKEAKM